MKFISKDLVLAVASVLYLSSGVRASDCDNLQKALKFFNDDVNKHFNIDKCCDFNGVRCDANKNIIELKFNNVNKTNDINGFIENIAQIKNLRYLDLANDNIEGAIPKSICTIKSLKNLNLAKNKLTGTIPYECKDLENLEQINLQGNQNLSGYVPYLTKLRGCAFKETGLCDISDAQCKNSPKTCTEEDIKNTNAKNGNPNPSSTEVAYPETRSRGDFNMYDNYGYSYGYSGYDDYSMYGGYDMSNYYGYGNDGAGYGYGDWGYNNGYDNSYYNNGYYGTGYDNYNNGYYGYDTNFYDSGYYDNGYYGNVNDNYNAYNYGYDNSNAGTNTSNQPSNTVPAQHTAFQSNTSAGFRNAGVNVFTSAVAFILFYLFRN